MTNWTFKQKSDNAFMNSFSSEVKKYIEIEDGFPSGLSRWLLDSFQLLNAKLPNKYGDYSFIVMPASKALESWIFKIANDLKIKINTDKASVVRDQIESHLNNVLGEVEKKLGDSIKGDISFLKNFIQEYRNNIVHFRKKIDSIDMARNKVYTIYERINSITSKLIEAGIIKVN